MIASKYDGKVVLSDRTCFTWVKEVAPQVQLYTALVWHITLKRKIHLADLLDESRPAKPGGVLLFSTDTTLDAYEECTARMNHAEMNYADACLNWRSYVKIAAIA